MRPALVCVILVALVVIAIPSIPVPTAVATDGPIETATIPGIPVKSNSRLSPSLIALVEQQESHRAAVFHETATGLSEQLQNDTVRVIVESLPGQAASVENTAAAFGDIEGSYEDMVQVVVPIDRLKELAENPQINLVRPPIEPLPLVISQGVSLTNADSWQQNGYIGIIAGIGGCLVVSAVILRRRQHRK